ncbi:MAG: hypothetical protein SGARI_007858 [Bacillariaceae sp.]
MTGLVKRFREDVLRDPVAQQIVLEAIETIVQDMSLDDNDSQVTEGATYAFYCEHGKHRSVSIAERVAELMRLARVPVQVIHRDVDRNKN